MKAYLLKEMLNKLDDHDNVSILERHKIAGITIELFSEPVLEIKEKPPGGHFEWRQAIISSGVVTAKTVSDD